MKSKLGPLGQDTLLIELFRDIRHSSTKPLVVLELVFFCGLFDNVVIRHQWNLADIGGDDVHGLGQTGGMAAQRIANQFCSFFNRGPKVVNPGSRLTIENIVRPAFSLLICLPSAK